MELRMRVAQAVHVLNHDSLSANRVAANQWLVQFQIIEAAWEVATSILTSDPPHNLDGYELHLFAAQVLKRKIQREGVALQAKFQSALQGSLLVSANKYRTGPPQLLTQICLALSALVLRAVELEKPVESLFSSLSGVQGHGIGNTAILELLTVLPEEVIDENVANATVNQERRWHFTQELLSHTGVVLEFLLQQTKEECSSKFEVYGKKNKVLRSLLSWVRVGCFLEIPPSSVASHPLLGFVLDSLQDLALFDLAIEVLVELVSRHEALPQVLLLKMQWFKEVLLLPAIENRNDRVIGGLSCLLAEIGQAAPMLITACSHEAFILIDALLRCLDYSDHNWEIADSTLNFWCSNIEFIMAIDKDVEKRKVLAAFTPVYSVVLDALFLRAKVVEVSAKELDETGSLPDGLIRFCRNLEELLTNIYYLLGPTKFLAKVLSGFWTTSDSQICWEMVEVRLFALNSVAEAVLEYEQQFDLSIIMQLIRVMRTTQVSVAPTLLHLVHKATAEVVGSFSKLVCMNSAEVLPVLSFLASGIQIPAAASSSAIALRKLCEEVPFVADDGSNLEGLLWIGQGLHKMTLTLREEEDVISAIGTVLALTKKEERLNASLKQVLEPSYDAIEALLSITRKDSSREHSVSYSIKLEAVVRALTRLGLIVNHLSDEKKSCHSNKSPVLNVLHYFWPLLERLLASCHMKSASLCAAVSRSLSFIIQALGQKFSTLLPEVMTALCQNFVSSHSSEYFIRTAAVALEEFGHKEEVGPLFIRTLSAFTEAEVIVIMNTSYACDQEPDVVEAYMAFTSTFLRCCPENVLVAAGSLLETSFKKATIWCTAMHRGAALSSMSYISRFLDAGASSLKTSGMNMQELLFVDLCLKIYAECGESTVCGVLYALLGVSAMTKVHKAATILHQLATICHFSESTMWKHRLGWNALQAWLTSVVHALPKEYLRAGEAEQMILCWLKAMKAAFSGHGHMQADGKRSLKRLVRDFADAHRHTAPSFGSM